MIKISNLKAREILDSKGEPTIECEVTLSDETTAIASVPSGASIGLNEAFELRDGDNKRFFGKGVLKAVNNVNTEIKRALIGQNSEDQQKIDKILIELDGTGNKKRLGGNAIVGVSMAICRAYAQSQKIELYEYFGELSGNKNFLLPQPLILVIEGGKHGNWSTDIQEYFLIFKREKFASFSKQFQIGNLVFKTVGEILKERGYGNSIGYEGAFSPAKMESNSEVLEIIIEAAERNNIAKNLDFVLGFDIAANSFFKDGKYQLKKGNRVLSSQEWLEYLSLWIREYPIKFIEDPFFEEDWDSWQKLTSALGNNCQIVGDDLLTTNVTRIKMAIEKRAVNSAIIKPNQIGTVTETLEAISLCQKSGLTPIVSHRGGETNDDLIADLCVGIGCPQVKFGGFRQNERLVKYLRLLDIEEELLSHSEGVHGAL